MKAILFHHAGGDKYAFRKMQEQLLPNIKSIAIELPGRGDRFSEPLLYNIENMLDDIFLQIKNELQEDYCFIGMSMGAVLCFLISHKIKNENLPLPKFIFLASRMPFQHYETNANLSNLSSNNFWDFILEYDNRSLAILENKELRLLFEPILRADFLAMQNFDNYFKTLSSLDIPSFILFGNEDHKLFDVEKATAWNQYFAKMPIYKGFNGGHFFLYENEQVTSFLIEQLQNGA